MESVVYLDTHAAAWLYAGEVELFSPRACTAIEGAKDIRISPMVVLELEYLREIGRLTVEHAVLISALERDIGLRICDRPFEEVATRATREKWTRDPFDRLIVAQAALGAHRLITKDRSIRSHYKRAIW